MRTIITLAITLLLSTSLSLQAKEGNKTQSNAAKTDYSIGFCEHYPLCNRRVIPLKKKAPKPAETKLIACAFYPLCNKKQRGLSNA